MPSSVPPWRHPMGRQALARSCALLLLLLGILELDPLYANELPKAFEATYTLSRNGLKIGEMRRSLKEIDQQQHVLESTTYATGFVSWFLKDRIVERSTWIYHQSRIRPLEYLYERSGGRKEKQVKLVFDWNKNVVTNIINNDPWRMEVPPQAMDKQIYQLALMTDLEAQPEELEYQIADGGKLKQYQFHVLGEEQLDTPLGKLNAVRIQRVGDKRGTTVWCARQLYYFPVQIEQWEKDGSHYKMQIKSLNGITKRAPAEAAM